jgi:hypothetical protein
MTDKRRRELEVSHIYCDRSELQYSQHALPIPEIFISSSHCGRCMLPDKCPLPSFFDLPKDRIDKYVKLIAEQRRPVGLPIAS